MNCLVVTVLIIGFRQEFKGKRRNANIASREGGTYVRTASKDKVVTVIDTRKLVSVTAPSRNITPTKLTCDFLNL